MSDPPNASLQSKVVRVSTLLCDADGNLFPSEEPAFAASTEVVNRLSEALDSPRRFNAASLRASSLGKNFRTVAREIAAELGVALSEEALENWVGEELRATSRRLAEALTVDREVLDVLVRLSRHWALAAVSSTALQRLEACFAVTGLAELFPPERRFSAEDSLPLPASKPDPAVYVAAGEALGVDRHEALAIEDSATGVRSAVAAGFATVGNLHFVAPEERRERARELDAAGAAVVVSSWQELERLLTQAARVGHKRALHTDAGSPDPAIRRPGTPASRSAAAGNP